MREFGAAAPRIEHVRALSETVREAGAVTIGKREIGIEGGKPGPGRGKRVSNADTLSGNERNSKSGLLRRLARSRPDLLERVKRGELSANKAAIEAGFRVRTYMYPKAVTA